MEAFNLRSYRVSFADSNGVSDEDKNIFLRYLGSRRWGR